MLVSLALLNLVLVVLLSLLVIIIGKEPARVGKAASTKV